MAETSYSRAKRKDHLHETEARWFALHTRSKSEKYVCGQLNKKGIKAYVPLQKLMRQYAKSTRMVEKPLINSYVFVHITQADYLPVLETDNVAGFVKFDRKMVAIPEAELELLRRFTLESDLEMEAVPGSIGVGDKVSISAGNLMGLSGRVLETQGKRKFLIELEHVGYSLLITVDKNFLEKVGHIA